MSSSGVLVGNEVLLDLWGLLQLSVAGSRQVMI